MTKAGVRRAALALVATVGLAGFGIGHATAGPTPRGFSHAPRYARVISRMPSSEPDAPDKVIIRCAGWTEDSINKLDLVGFERDGEQLRAVYKCN